MKTLQELDISPVPWSNIVGTEKPFEINSVWDARNGCILSGGYAQSVNDARLTAAGPKLYKALREAIIEICHKCKHCSGYPSYNCTNTKTGCFVEKWRDVLDEAAGVGLEK